MTIAESTRPPAPEALFGTFLEGLRDVYARGGMRDVLQLAVAAAATAPPVPVPAAGTPDSAARAAPLAGIQDDALFEALVAALEDAFCRGGLEAAMHELAVVGGVVERAARADPVPEPEAPGERRAMRFAQAAYEKAVAGRRH
jgi:hypothetical protein